MSRLDDELKIAFQRQEPPADFAAHVLARLNEASVPQARPTVWQRLASVFAMPRLGYAAVGAMALLLIIIGIALLRSPRPAGVENNAPQVAISPGNPASEKPAAGNATPEQNASDKLKSGQPEDGTNASLSSTTAGHHAEPSSRPGGSHRLISHRAPVVAQQSQPQPSAEALAAKEKVLFALQITSETLNDVQRVISDDRPQDEKPEPVQKR
ncbi:MAG: hypothetical protein V7641_2585 [Blastocatellia bacterium]